MLQIWGSSDVTDCVAHAYGTPVLAYLRSHQCHGIHRVLASTTVNGRQVGIAAENVTFTGASADKAYRAAGGLAELVTKDGTGNVSDLIREGVRIPGGPSELPYPDTFFAGAQDNGTLVYEAFYLKGPTSAKDPVLRKLIMDVVLQF